MKGKEELECLFCATGADTREWLRSSFNIGNTTFFCDGAIAFRAHKNLDSHEISQEDAFVRRWSKVICVEYDKEATELSFDDEFINNHRIKNPNEKGYKHEVFALNRNDETYLFSTKYLINLFLMGCQIFLPKTPAHNHDCLHFKCEEGEGYLMPCRGLI
ncbi:hypothetical protein [Agarilytica rhodophyticola]|uniref:hypothetical protein n=1 Tax=Agarilytica rhodophyticola TaxID=1737490 RepID=UPI000B3477B2|nr:hypothetical protein [Agarilytica rhodophyticola]